MSLSNIKTIEPNAVYKPEDAAELLQVDKSFVYKAYKSGDLDGKEMGRGVKFLGQDLLRYAGTATPIEERNKTISNAGVPSMDSTQK